MSKMILFNIILYGDIVSRGVYRLDKLGQLNQTHQIQSKKMGWAELLSEYGFQNEKFIK
jgi:hypothetical protein